MISADWSVHQYMLLLWIGTQICWFLLSGVQSYPHVHTLSYWFRLLTSLGGNKWWLCFYWCCTSGKRNFFSLHFVHHVHQFGQPEIRKERSILSGTSIIPERLQSHLIAWYCIPMGWQYRLAQILLVDKQFTRFHTPVSKTTLYVHPLFWVIFNFKLWVFEKAVSHVVSRKMRTKNVAVVFKRPYLDNSKTQMFSLLFYLVLYTKKYVPTIFFATILHKISTYKLRMKKTTQNCN